MREMFTCGADLFGYYRFIKSSVVSMPTILPKKDSDGKGNMNAFFARSLMEERLAFIGDVENFVKYYHSIQTGSVRVPVDCLLLIFKRRFCPEDSRHMSFGQLARHFKRRVKNGELVPKRLCHKENIYKIARDMSERSDDYAKLKGYVTE